MKELAAISLLLLLALCIGCAHPTAAQAGAQSQAGVEEQTQAGAGTQTQAASGAQADSSARVQVHRGPRHFHAEFSPPADGGAPVFKLDLDDEGDDVIAGATGVADAGAESAADAGASGLADAGATSGADAGASAQASPAPAGFPWLAVLVALGIAAVAGFLFLRGRLHL